MTSRWSIWHFFASGLEMLLAATIGLLLLALAWAHNVRFDLTPTKENTLTDQTRRTARRLQDDVKVTFFYSSQDQGRVRETKELLRRLSDESPHIHFVMVDLDRNPLLANREGIVNYNSAVVEGMGQKSVLGDVSEPEITTSLIRLIEGKERVALFTTGHGELDPEKSEDRAGFSQAAKSLAAESYRIERSRDLRSGIPEEVALLVVGGPTRDFTTAEIAAVEAFLQRGGGMLLLLEAEAPPRVQELVRKFGIEPGNDLIVDERNRLFFQDSFAPQVVYFNEDLMPFTDAPPAILPLAQSISVDQTDGSGMVSAPLAFTGDDTWADVERRSMKGGEPQFREEVDRRGPVPVAALARLSKPADPSTSGSMVVVGDREFADNLNVGSLGNRDFFLNLAHLAARAEGLIASRGASRPGGTFSSVQLSAAQARLLFSLAVVVLPAVVLLLGAVTAWRRQRLSAA